MSLNRQFTVLYPFSDSRMLLECSRFSLIECCADATRPDVAVAATIRPLRITYKAAIALSRSAPAEPTQGKIAMSMAADDSVPPKSLEPRLRPLPQLIFSSRWLQLPLYLGLIVAQGVYVILFLKELWHLVLGSMHFNEQEIMLVVLGLIDVVMISNLLTMVIVGGYETFVSRLELEKHPDQPEWLSHVNASVLKIKLAMAIIGISSIHLLRTFIYAGSLGKEGVPYTETGVMWQVIIHGLFVLSAIGIAYVEHLGQSSYNKPHH
jgi:uncharacterized protein (TIGR00645 family)